MSALFLLSVGVVYFVYDGYLRLLTLGCRLAPRDRSSEREPQPLPALTVLITVRNEAGVITQRLDNIFACDYPQERLHVMVASDGSTDGTDELVQHYPAENLVLFRPTSSGGKTSTQNQAVAQATGDVVVFTDADTVFASSCLLRLAEAFADETVGCVDGHVLLVSEETRRSGGVRAVSESQGRYWAYELAVRQAESQLDLLAVASGACMAIRRVLFRPIPDATGEDCYLPLDVVRQGFRVVHGHQAVAYMLVEPDGARAFATRVRMTLRNWQGTWMFAHLLNPVAHPGYAFALWSHKILRWLSPMFMILATAVACARAVAGQPVFRAITVAIGVFALVGVFGWWIDRRGTRTRIAGTVYSFGLANAAFLVGTLRALLGDTIRRYK